jgi:hypothetical protein
MKCKKSAIQSYIQYAAGYSKEYVAKLDVQKAIKDIQQMDEEHGAFWISVFTEGENVIEIEKSLAISAILEPEYNKEIKYKAHDWKEVENLLILLLNKKFEEIKQIINKN